MDSSPSRVGPSGATNTHDTRTLFGTVTVNQFGTYADDDDRLTTETIDGSTTTSGYDPMSSLDSARWRVMTM